MPAPGMIIRWFCLCVSYHRFLHVVFGELVPRTIALGRSSR
ncbi:MAG: hypothetical protein ACLRXQ_10675 [Phascolarctobacterium faecium]